MNKIIISLAAVVIIALFFVLSRGSQRNPSKQLRYSYKRKEHLLSPAELACFNELQTALGNDFFIFPQVHLSSLADYHVKGQRFESAFRHINGKSVDFVLCDRAHAFLPIAIELDDRSHEKLARVERDGEVERILEMADVPLLRLECQKRWVPEELRSQINKLCRHK